MSVVRYPHPAGVRAGRDASLRVARRRPLRLARYAAPASLLLVIGGGVAVVERAPTRPAPGASAHRAAHAPARRLPRYWTVRSGDTFSAIAVRTGLSVAVLEALNPQLRPSRLVPGQRLELHPAPPGKAHHVG